MRELIEPNDLVLCFESEEVEILMSALMNWKGPYSTDSILNDFEKKRKERLIVKAESMRGEIEDIMRDRFERNKS